MPHTPLREPVEIELSLGPHPARDEWRVLRVTYAHRPEHEARIARALEALTAPVEPRPQDTGRGEPVEVRR